MSNPPRVTAWDVNDAVAKQLRRGSCHESLLVAVSGIDASGKTTTAQSICRLMQQAGYHAVIVSSDDWHSPWEVRYSTTNSAEHYYHHAYRFTDLFNALVLPLKRDRSVCVTTEVADSPSDGAAPGARRTKTYDLRDVDVTILEGVFLLKSAYVSYYNFRYWIDCPFETARTRALQRNQERLSRAEVLYLYSMVYFPAQRIHLVRDDPVSHADGLLVSECRAALGEGQELDR